MPPATPQIGDAVIYHYWIGGDAGQMFTSPAVVTEVLEIDHDGVQPVKLMVDFPDDILVAQGYVREQSHARQRVRDEDDIHNSGTWSPTS
jgi:hypothetical protein